MTTTPAPESPSLLSELGGLLRRLVQHAGFHTEAEVLDAHRTIAALVASEGDLSSVVPPAPVAVPDVPVVDPGADIPAVVSGPSAPAPIPVVDTTPEQVADVAGRQRANPEAEEAAAVFVPPIPAPPVFVAPLPAGPDDDKPAAVSAFPAPVVADPAVDGTDDEPLPLEGLHPAEAPATPIVNG